jgi:hypothetical protein
VEVGGGWECRWWAWGGLNSMVGSDMLENECA